VSNIASEVLALLTEALQNKEPALPHYKNNFLIKEELHELVGVVPENLRHLLLLIERLLDSLNSMDEETDDYHLMSQLSDAITDLFFDSLASTLDIDRNEIVLRADWQVARRKANSAIAPEVAAAMENLKYNTDILIGVITQNLTSISGMVARQTGGKRGVVQLVPKNPK
jgi:hypothetical protein